MKLSQIQEASYHNQFPPDAWIVDLSNADDIREMQQWLVRANSEDEAIDFATDRSNTPEYQEETAWNVAKSIEQYYNQMIDDYVGKKDADEWLKDIVETMRKSNLSIGQCEWLDTYT